MSGRRRSRFVPWGTSYRHVPEAVSASNESLFQHREGANELPYREEPAELDATSAIIQSVLGRIGSGVPSSDHHYGGMDNSSQESLPSTSSSSFNIRRISSENLSEMPSNENVTNSLSGRTFLGCPTDITSPRNLSERPSNVSLSDRTSHGNLSNLLSYGNLSDKTSNGDLSDRPSHGDLSNIPSCGTRSQRTSNGNLSERRSLGNLTEGTWRGCLSRSSSLLSSYSRLSMKSQTSESIKQFNPNYEWSFNDIDTHAIVQRDFRFVTITPSTSHEDDRDSNISTGKNQHSWTEAEREYLMKAMSKALALKAIDGAMEEILGIAKNCPYSLGAGLQDMNRPRHGTMNNRRTSLFETFQTKIPERGCNRSTQIAGAIKQYCETSSSSPPKPQIIDFSKLDVIDDNLSSSSESLNVCFDTGVRTIQNSNKYVLEKDKLQTYGSRNFPSQLFTDIPSSDLPLSDNFYHRHHNSDSVYQVKNTKDKRAGLRKPSPERKCQTHKLERPSKSSKEYDRMPSRPSYRATTKTAKQHKNTFILTDDLSIPHDPGIYRGHSVHRVTDYFDCRPPKPAIKGRSSGIFTDHSLPISSGRRNHLNAMDQRTSDNGQKIKKYLENGSLVLDFKPRRAW